MKIASRKS